mgnify:CR=1 FL=1
MTNINKWSWGFDDFCGGSYQFSFNKNIFPLIAGRLQLDKEINLFNILFIYKIIVHSTIFNFDWSRAVQFIPNCTRRSTY